MHLAKADFSGDWKNIPGSADTLRRHIRVCAKSMLKAFEDHNSLLGFYRIEHRIYCHRPSKGVISRMQDAGLFSLAGLNRLFFHQLGAGGIALRPVLVNDFLASLRRILLRVEEQHSLQGLPDSNTRSLPGQVLQVWAEVMNACGLSHPLWNQLLDQPDTWDDRLLTDEQRLRAVGKNMRLLNPEQVEAGSVLEWQWHPKDRNRITIRGKAYKDPVSGTSVPPRLMATFATLHEACLYVTFHYPFCRWKGTLQLHDPANGPSLWKQALQLLPQGERPLPAAIIPYHSREPVTIPATPPPKKKKPSERFLYVQQVVNGYVEQIRQQKQQQQPQLQPPQPKRPRPELQRSKT